MKFEKYNEDEPIVNKQNVLKKRVVTPVHSHRPLADERPKFQQQSEQKHTSEQQLFVDEKLSPKNLNLNILQNNLGNCLSIIDNEVMKGYVTKLNRLPIMRLDANFCNQLQNIHFFKISELVYQEEEFSVDKLAMVFHTLSNKPCTLVLMLKSDGEKIDFYLGTRPNGTNSAGTLFQMLKQSLLGFFPGSKISEYYDEDMRKDMQSLKVNCISSVTCVADYKQEYEAIGNKDFIQGLEKFVYAMQGKSYTAVFIADNLAHDELMLKKREYEQIYTQISPFVNMQMNFTVSDGGSSSVGSSEGTTKNAVYTQTRGSSQNETDTNTYTVGLSNTVGITKTDTDTHTDNQSKSKGTNHTVGTSDGKSKTVTDGFNLGISSGVFAGGAVGVAANVGGSILGAGVNAGVNAGANTGISAGYNHSVAKGTNHTDSVSDSVSKTLTYGFSDSYGHSHSDSKTYGTNKSSSEAKSISIGTNANESYALGNAFNLVNTKTMTDTFGSSKGVTLNAQNMTLNLVLQKLQKHLERIEECESFGMWNFASYFLGETAAESETAANTYKSVVAGMDSGIERNAINSWVDKEMIAEIFLYLQNFLHPQFIYNGFSYNGDRYMAVNPSALVSTNELAIHMGLPRHSVRGLPVVEHTPFAQEIITAKNSDESKSKVNLGTVYHLGQNTNTQVELDLDSLTMHTFVTGSTGSGKSNAIYHLLTEIRRKGIPFLVIEPAKGEYKNIFTDVRCFGTNPKMGEILKINPFSFPEGIHILEHIDHIVEIFNVCWPMYAAMPAVLKEAIEQAYVSVGWDLDLSENTKIDKLFPTFDDVLRELNNTIYNSKYSSDTKGDYIGALSTRIKSLTNGINGRIFVNDEMDLADLFDKNAIIDISRIGAMETKSLIMGFVILKLQEYRMVYTEGMNLPLKHITVLEEAHNLLKKTSTNQSAELSNMVGKSVEMLTNAIAEIRTYGEGFIIADQAPNLLDTTVIRNTNTKMIFRLPESDDREITGSSMALKEQQLSELSKLPIGVAAVYQNNWQEAVLCSLPKYKLFNFTLHKKDTVPIIKEIKKQNDELLHFLLKKQLSDDECVELQEKIKVSNISAKIRKDLILNLKKRNNIYEWAVADFIQKNFNLSNVFRGTANCSNLDQLANIMKQNIEEEFYDFNDQEMFVILYYICRIEHELYPENKVIELLRTSYLREKVM